MDTPTRPPGRLESAVSQIAAHDHLCLVYETPEERFAALAPYVKAGLRARDRMVYVADESTAAGVLEGLREEGVDVDDALRDGAIVVARAQDALLRDGAFEPRNVISAMEDALKDAEDLGFASLRMSGEMTWSLGPVPGRERVMECESLLNRFLPRHNLSAICQYDATRFSPEVVASLLQVHPQIIYGDLVCSNAHYVQPDDFLLPDQPRRQLRRLLESILERERAERELRELREALDRRVAERTRLLSAANRELESFSYTVAHDLRAPLRGILVSGEALQEDFGDALPPGASDHIDRIQGEASRMSRLVEELLRLSRMQGSEREERVDLSATAASVLAELRRQHPLRQVDARVEEGLAARGDPTLLRSVLQNLLGNAWKYSAERPRAHIELGALPRHDGGGAMRTFFVRDDGVGFSPEKSDLLFEPFQRLHGKEFEGTGVGLATVKRIVARHGGRVWADGAPDKGATFWFTLPAA